MLENNEGVQWGNLSELPLAVGTRRESPVQLPWGLVLCGAAGLVTASHTHGGGGPRVGRGLRRDGTFVRTYSELHALCSYWILTRRPEIDAIIILISQFWKPKLREVKQPGATLITGNVWIQTQILPIPEAQHYFFQQAWPVCPMLSCLRPLHKLWPQSGVLSSSFFYPSKDSPHWPSVPGYSAAGKADSVCVSSAGTVMPFWWDLCVCPVWTPCLGVLVLPGPY